jgi:hypothetical protein
VSALGSVPNVYNYLDLSNAGQLGYQDNLVPAANLAAEVVGGDGGPGFDSVAGFATNVNSYVATVETFLPNPDLVVGGIVLYEGSSFFDWSRHLDVTDHVEPVRNGLIAAGFPPGIGALVDTGQNGWGGPERPTAVSTSFDVDTYVAESRLDRRRTGGPGATRSVPDSASARPPAPPTASTPTHGLSRRAPPTGRRPGRRARSGPALRGAPHLVRPGVGGAPRGDRGHQRHAGRAAPRSLVPGAVRPTGRERLPAGRIAPSGAGG